MAQAPKSLLPAFGNEGAEFTVKAKDGHVVKGWLPKEWTDNTDWRVKVEKVDEGGQLQITTYAGNQKYKKGTKYVVTGWR
jgi:hypothetical protein